MNTVNNYHKISW